MFGSTRHTWRVIPSWSHYLISEAPGRLSLYLCLGTPNWSAQSGSIDFREQPIETNEYHSVDGAEGEFLWSSSPQNVDLLPQRPNLCLKHYPRPNQIDNHPTNEPAKIPHCARSSSDSRSTAK